MEAVAGPGSGFALQPMRIHLTVFLMCVGGVWEGSGAAVSGRHEGRDGRRPGALLCGEDWPAGQAPLFWIRIWISSSLKQIFLTKINLILFTIFPIFTYVDPYSYSEYGSRSTKLLNMDPIWMRIHITGDVTLLYSIQCSGAGGQGYKRVPGEECAGGGGEDHSPGRRDHQVGELL